MLLAMHREQDDARAGVAAHDRARGLDAVHVRHRQVEHGDVGLEIAHEVERALPVVGLADDLDALALQQRAQGMPQDLMIVSEQHAHRGPPRAGA